MPSHRISGPHLPITGADFKASLGDLSCPCGGRNRDGEPAPRWSASEDRGAARTRGARAHGLPHRYRPLAADYWHPPASARQRAQQRVLAVLVAFVLVALLGWLEW